MTARPAKRGPAASAARASSPTNAAGRTLAALITGQDTELTRFPWVNHRSGLWEPEPVRGAGVRAMLAGLRVRDRKSQRVG